MPQTFLHIRADDSPASRVLELAGTSVRIGRGLQCEVWLNEPALAEVQCMLRRKADTWYVLPVGPPGRIALEGGPINHQQPLPVGAALRVGSHWLALQPPESAPDELGSFSSPIPVEAIAETEPTARSLPGAPDLERPSQETVVEPEPAVSPAGLDSERERLERWQARLEQRERWLKTRQAERKWEARWKAAGAHLQARSVAPPRIPDPPSAPPPAPPRPPAVEVEARRAGWQKPPITSWTDAPSVTRIVPSARTTVPVEPPSSPHVAEPPHRVAAPAPAGPDLRQADVPDVPRLDPQPLSGLVPEPVSPDWAAADPGPGQTSTVRARLVSRLPHQPAAEPSRRPRQSPPPFRAEVEPRGTDPTAARRPALPVAPKSEHAPSTPRNRVAGQPSPEGARDEATMRPRPQATAAPETVVVRPPSAESTPAPLERLPEGPEWPSAAAILASRPRREPGSTPRRAPARPNPHRPAPTVAIAPDQWSLPFWPAWTTSAACAIGASLIGLTLAWSWALDDAAAARLADRLFAHVPAGASATHAPMRPPDPVDAPAASWWRSTPSHLFGWAMAEHRAESSTDQADAFLLAARGASPLHAASAFAEEQVRAGQNPHEGLAASLGLSRDIIPLTWAAHRLRLAGKPDAALRLYAAALDLAARSKPADQPPPAFGDENDARFQLPYEALIRPIVQDMAEGSGWTFSDWSRALPDFAVASLVAGRVLRAQRRPAESDQALDMAITQAREPAEVGASAAVHLAAGAEALALRQRWREAEDLYQIALEQMPHDRIRRSWWLNLAQVYQQLNDDPKRLAAWESARGTDPNDEITKRVLAAMVRAGVAPAPTVKRGQAKSRLDRVTEKPQEPATPSSQPTLTPGTTR